MDKAKQYRAIGDDIWANRTLKINAELLALTYGSIVGQLTREYKNDFTKINEKLRAMGYNIGVRLVEDFYARSAMGRCRTIEETGLVLTQVAFKMFLNVTPQIQVINETELHIFLNENPLSAFVELPPFDEDDLEVDKSGDGSGKSSQLWYSNILCGVIKGALEQVAIDCEVEFVRDVLLGDHTTELRISGFKFLKDEVPAGED
ncbi:hypothetical protein ACO0RG_003896 [Hanseniaspora osmophila]|uniref:Trafficking protein particle complex subunit BET3 n=1 Tax=Hanseniaspora osmophila TaxID=56408 RepID=A0A1E5RA17_9ASCO|nr:Trafficking protein particle complex subunit BET3 [Hanseniaspora osmophila]